MNIIKKYIDRFKELKKNYVIMCTLAALQGLVFYAPISTLYRTSRGISVAEIFLTETVLLITMILFEIPFGYFSDKYGYKKTLIVSSIILFISKVVFFSAYSIEMFIVQAILSGISMSGFSGCTEAFIFESTDNENTEKVFGIYNAVGTASFLVASFVSSILTSISMDTTVFITIIPFAIGVIVTFLLDDINIDENKDKLKLSVILIDMKKIKRIFLFILATTLIMEVSHAIEAFLNQLQYIRSNIDLKYFGIINVLGQLACLTSGIVYKVTKKYGQRKTLFMLFILIIINIVILIFTTYWLVTIMGIIVIQASTAMAIPIMIDIENKSIDKNRATMLSIYSMASSIIASIINIFIGKYADISVEKSLVFSCILISIACVILLIYYKIDDKSKTR